MATTAPTLPDKDTLPYWMRQAQRGWDWGLLLSVIVGLFAAWPFIAYDGLPRNNAMENYVFLAADFSDALAEGRLYPRWSPHALNGYGSPIPHYYPPATGYSAALVKLLFTDDPVLAFRLLYIGVYVLAAVTTYDLVRRYTHAAGGVTAAALYLFSPFIGHIAPYTLGDAPLIFSIALIPLFLWASSRLILLNRPINLFGVALCFALLILTHLQSALSVLLILPALLATESTTTARRRLYSALLIGVGLSAFFWLPALAEQHLVMWLPGQDYFQPAITLSGLFRPFTTVDLNALIQQPQFTFGLLHTCALLCALWVYFRSERKRFYLAFLLNGLILLIVMLTFAPQESWLLTPIMLCLAVFISVLTTWEGKLPARWQSIYVPSLLGCILFFNASVWLPPRWPADFGPVTPLEQVRYEDRTNTPAVLPAQYPIPTTLSVIPAENPTLISGYQFGSINRVIIPQAQNRPQISLLQHGTHHHLYQVQNNGTNQVDILTAYFDGWTATDGQLNIPLHQNPQTGLMQLDIPTMNGILAISLGPTPTRQFAWVVSGLSLLLGIGLTQWRTRRQSPLEDEPDLLPIAKARLISIVLAVMIGVVLIAAVDDAPLSLYPPIGYELDGAEMIRTRTEVGLEALAYRLNSVYYHPGDTVNLTLYWQALRPLFQNYKVQLHLIHESAIGRWQPGPLQSPGGFPTTRWQSFRHITDQQNITLSPSIIPGTYQIALEVFECVNDDACETGKRLTFFDSQGRQLGPVMTLPQTITIRH
jgi:hypothetical protein